MKEKNPFVAFVVCGILRVYTSPSEVTMMTIFLVVFDLFNELAKTSAPSA